MILEEAKELIKKAPKKNRKLKFWNNGLIVSWLYDLLFKNRAISNLSIVCDCYCLTVEGENESNYEYSDDIRHLELRKETIEKELQKRRKKAFCYIAPVPHAYTMLIKAYNELF